MPTRSLPTVDPVFAGIAEAIYGDVDPREIAKFAPGSSDLHSDGPMTAAQAKRQKRVAQTGLAATGVAGAAGLHAVTASIGEQKRRMAEAKGVELPAAKVGRVAGALKRMGVKPTVAAGVIGGGLLALHGVELASDAMGAHAQLKQLNQANKQVNKAFRLKPLNALPVQVPSLRAKRIKLNPLPANPRTKGGLYQPMSKSLRSVYRGGRETLRNVYRTTEHARGTTEQVENATRSAAQASEKLGRLIPSPRTAALIGAGTVGTLATAPAAGFYAGARAGVRSRDRKRPRAMPARVAKSELAEVTWTGEIAKVDADKRQVFGWASVSAVNGQPVVDLQGDVVPIEEMEESAYRYVIESRKGGDMHRRVAKADQPLHVADMIESFVVTPEKLEKMGLPGNALPHGWWVGYKVNNDEQWNLVKSGARTGFSIHGKGTRTALSKADRPKIRVRAEQAIHPPAVKLHPVKSTAIASMGYQPQTRRLAVEMRTRPGEPYEYKMGRGQAMDALNAPSKGYHYATAIRGKVKRAKGYSPADRARLFVDPVSKALGDKLPPRDGRLPGDNRNAEMARSRRTAGLSTAGLGYLVASRHSDVAPGMADWVTRSPKKIGEAEHAAKVARRTARIGRISTKGGAGLVAGGLALAGEGAFNDLRNRGSFTRTGKQARKKFQSLGKAYDSEKNRHNRQNLYAGGAAGGAVVSGAKAVQAGRAARRTSRAAGVELEHLAAAHKDLQNTLAVMHEPGTRPTRAKVVEAAAAHTKAIGHQDAATVLARRAKTLRRISGSSALGTAALGAAALGVHTYDRHRGGRSYAY
jgi:hypothetical protein